MSFSQATDPADPDAGRAAVSYTVKVYRERRVEECTTLTVDARSADDAIALARCIAGGVPDGEWALCGDGLNESEIEHAEVLR